MSIIKQISNTQKIILAIPILLMISTVPVFGFGYEGLYNITLKPGETVDREVTLRLERNSDIVFSVIGEGKEWITTPPSIKDIAEGTKKVKHPFTITVPEDIELAGDYKTYVVATQKGETGGIIVINEEALIGMTITIEDPSLPKKIGKMSLTEIYAEEKIIRDAAKAVEDLKKANAPKEDKPKDPPPVVPGVDKPENTPPVSPGEDKPVTEKSKPSGNSVMIIDPVEPELKCGEGAMAQDGICVPIPKESLSWFDAFIESILNIFKSF